mmetsp:Transcript_37759/g.89327  ORF Transcript_37759/g.89327 Transcript_37759/m.89327 type:complete len:233 (-) Transcript_37759:58-756(-)
MSTITWFTSPLPTSSASTITRFSSTSAPQHSSAALSGSVVSLKAMTFTIVPSPGPRTRMPLSSKPSIGRICAGKSSGHGTNFLAWLMSSKAIPGFAGHINRNPCSLTSFSPLFLTGMSTVVESPANTVSRLICPRSSVVTSFPPDTLAILASRQWCPRFSKTWVYGIVTSPPAATVATDSLISCHPPKVIPQSLKERVTAISASVPPLFPTVTSMLVSSPTTAGVGEAIIVP